MIRYVAIVLTSLCVSIGWGAGAQAQSTITPSTYYVSSLGSESCGNNATFCTIYFDAIPQKYVLITNVSCYIESSSVLRSIRFGVADGSGTFLRTVYLPSVADSTSTNRYYYNLNEQINVVAGPGRKPAVSLYQAAASPAVIVCTVSGETIPNT